MSLRIPTLFALVMTISVLAPAGGSAQRGGRGGFAGAASNLPADPVAVALPTVTGPVEGPGAPYESVQSLAPGLGLDHYDYQAVEYFVSGTAADAPYRTRIVIRRPRSASDFSGQVLAEAMHPSGSAHMFEFTSVYSMNSGHIAVDILVSGLENLTAVNPERYGDLTVTGAQTNEVLAQVGALIREGGDDGPMGGLTVENMVLGGTSATSAILVQYLPAHDIYRTPSMGQIFDGYLAHSNGSTIPNVGAPLIQVPTMTEVRNANVTVRQDGDRPGDQYRLYEFAGMGHVDSRDSVRTQPNPCANPVSLFPLQAYLSVALDHLLAWSADGILPPRANRILIDRNEDNDGSLMALDAHGNVIGGIRNPYVDVPVARYAVPNSSAATLPEVTSEWIAANGPGGARQICGLGAYQIAFDRARLSELYGSKTEFVRQVETRLDELEAAGWSLPVYHDMIMADANAVQF